MIHYLFLLLLFLATSVEAQGVYKCVAAKGTEYQETPCTILKIYASPPPSVEATLRALEARQPPSLVAVPSHYPYHHGLHGSRSYPSFHPAGLGCIGSCPPPPPRPAPTVVIVINQFGY